MLFYNIACGEKPYYKHQGWLSGRITTDDNFTMYRKPALDENAPPVPEGDFVANADAGMYYVSVDPSGKLGWESHTLTYNTTKAHVLEVLTNKAGNAYKAFLRKLGISYIIVGEEALDYALLMEKLATLFDIKTFSQGLHLLAGAPKCGKSWLAKLLNIENETILNFNVGEKNMFSGLLVCVDCNMFPAK